MRNVILFICLIGFFPSVTVAQSGFAGNRNQLQVDLFRMIYGYYQADYKFCVSEHFALGLTGGLISKKVELDGGSLSSDNSLLKTAEFSGGSIGLGIAYNSAYNDMPMPIGYYMGMYFVKSFGDYNQYKTGGVIDNSYDYHGNLFKITFGKNIVMYKNVTLDLGIAYGVNWGYMKALNGENSPATFIPTSLVFTQQNQETEFSNDYYLHDAKYRFLKFYLMPEIKVGYMF